MAGQGSGDSEYHTAAGTRAPVLPEAQGCAAEKLSEGIREGREEGVRIVSD